MFSLWRLVAKASAAVQPSVHTASTFPRDILKQSCGVENLWSELGFKCLEFDIFFPSVFLSEGVFPKILPTHFCLQPMEIDSSSKRRWTPARINTVTPKPADTPFSLIILICLLFLPVSLCCVLSKTKMIQKHRHLQWQTSGLFPWCMVHVWLLVGQIP